MSRRSNSHARLAADAAELWFHSFSVIALRTSLMAWQMAPEGEEHRMISEKQPAFVEASMAATQAATRAMLRAPFDPAGVITEATGAWTRSLSRKARANRKRLSKLGSS